MDTNRLLAELPLAGHWLVPSILKKDVDDRLKGYHVYIIWDDCSDRPVYVGSSRLGFKRIFQHFRCKGKDSPAGYLLKVAQPWSGWTVSFFGPFDSKTRALRTEHLLSRKMKPWHCSTGKRSGLVDIDNDGTLPWYIRELLYRRELATAAAKVERVISRRRFLSERICTKTQQLPPLAKKPPAESNDAGGLS